MQTYTHLTLAEREILYAEQRTGTSLRDIAKRLGRSHTSLSRELKRNIKYGNEYFQNEYLPCKAQALSDKRAAKQRQKAPLKEPLIFLYVREHLRKPYYWTPEEIAGRLPLDHPGYTIDDETIYRYIYGKRQRQMKLWQHLRLHRKRRLKKAGRKVKGNKRIASALPIEDRPEKANTREEAGHFETDNVGTIKTDKTGISATVERKVRVIRLRKLKDQKARTKRRVLVAQMKREDKRMRKSLTIDGGPENSEHQQFTKATAMPVYKCNAYHSWEKGSVENGIGRLRFFIPKGVSVDHLTQQDLDSIEAIMNNTPRKCLGYLTPNEMLERILSDPRT
jgi:IS30 family transposase